MRRGYVRPPTLAGDYVIQGVTVVDTADGTLTAEQDLRIHDGVIQEIGAGLATLTASTVLDGRGRFAVPGFVDMHAHALNQPRDIEGAYALMLAAGVTGYRQMSGSSDLLALRRRGGLPHPAGAPRVLAMPGEILTPFSCATPEMAAATVRQQHDDGADFIKSAMASGESFLAALDEARRVGIPLAGHLPADVDPREAARRGMRSIEHLGPGASVFAATSRDETAVRAAALRDPGPRLPSIKLPGMDRVIGRIIRGIVVNPSSRTTPAAAQALRTADETFDVEAAQELAAHFVANETWQCPTLVRVHTQQLPDAAEHQDDSRVRWIHPDELKRWRSSAERFAKLPAGTRDALRLHFDAQLRLTKIFADAGVPLLAGSDADGAGWVIPGFGLHDEFDLLARAGLAPLHILRLATSEPARFLGAGAGAGAGAGRLQAGARADVVLLDDNPVVDHRALHAISGVVSSGDYWSRDDLDTTLARVADAPGAR
jgi:imidazolonepropionase-like amidohydrolase